MGGNPCHVLALNAAEGLLQLVLARQENTGDTATLIPLCAQSWHAPSQGAELLAPALQNALERLRLQPGDIGKIACVRGPGSFTGLRLVLATAAGLSRATGALQAGLDYLTLLAESAYAQCAPLAQEPCRIWVLTHARRQLIHLQGFRAVDRGVRPVGDILVLSPLEAVKVIVAGREEAGPAERTLLLGSGLSRNRESLREALSMTNMDTVLLPEGFDHPTVPALLEAAAKADFSLRDAEPCYVRPSDAEENLESIAASLGLDPLEARKKLERLTLRTPGSHLCRE